MNPNPLKINKNELREKAEEYIRKKYENCLKNYGEKLKKEYEEIGLSGVLHIDYLMLNSYHTLKNFMRINNVLNFADTERAIIFLNRGDFYVVVESSIEDIVITSGDYKDVRSDLVEKCFSAFLGALTEIGHAEVNGDEIRIKSDRPLEEFMDLYCEYSDVIAALDMLERDILRL